MYCPCGQPVLYRLPTAKKIRDGVCVKRILCLILAACFIAAISGCGNIGGNESLPNAATVEPRDKIMGLWVSYSELAALVKGDFKTDFSNLLRCCKDTGITDLFVHVRAFCDAIYPSELFPLSAGASEYSGDLLNDMIELTHGAGIRFHAWINPFRVRTADENVDMLPDNSPAKIWLRDDNAGNDINVCFSNGIYLNPASEEVRKLVIDGIREIINKYHPDGIHFDDYFYPTTDESFDKSSYSAYCDASAEPVSLSDWRRAQVNQLISGCYTAVKFCDKETVFSVSPAASVEKNYSAAFADIAAWLRAGCVDWIIPQLYFGFEYPDSAFRFEKLLDTWSGLRRAEGVRLIIGLAAYKLGTTAAPDAAEWENGAEILSKQLELSEKKADGVVFFSSGSLFSENELNKRALELLKAK